LSFLRKQESLVGKAIAGQARNNKQYFCFAATLQQKSCQIDKSEVLSVKNNLKCGILSVKIDIKKRINFLIYTLFVIET